MNEFTQAELLQRVTESNRPSGSPRAQKIVARIVGDLFRAIDDLDISPDEFWVGVDWLTRLGATGQGGLITAGLGFDRLLDIRSDEADQRAGRLAGTPRAIEGPLYIPGAPLAYAIPPNSPTAELFSAIGRHGNRPAHIHFLVTAPGLRTLTTQVNVPGDSFIDDDFAFATRDGLILTLEPNTPAQGYESLGIETPFTRVPFDFVMQPAASEDESLPEARLARAVG